MSSVSLAQRGSQGETSNPVYLADAPVAIETLQRAKDLVEQGSVLEAARSLTELIIEHGDRLTPLETNDERTGDDGADAEGVWIRVRVRVERVILNDPELLDAYRKINTPKAQRILDDGDWELVEQNYWLTAPGCDAGLHQAQVSIESGRFGVGAGALERLLEHPDARERSGRGFELSGLVFRAWDTERSRSVAQGWADLTQERGDWDRLMEGDRFEGVVAPEVQVSALRTTPMLAGSPELRLEGIVSHPITAARLTPFEAAVGLGFDGRIDDTQISGATSKPKPWSMPAVMGDALITNDGVTISCFDRFTLRQRWRVTTRDTEVEELSRANAGVRARIARTIEDLSSVTVSEGVVYAAAGLARTGGRTGDDRLLAIDLESGKILRSTTLDELDPSLVGSTIRGSVIVDGDTLVVSARKNLRRERLVAMSLVGIDRRSFELLWVRPIGSAGSLPFQQIGQISHSGVLEDGVVYWTDMMGLACSVESVSGRVLWARVMPTTDVYGRYERDPWTVSTPIVHGDDVYILSVDGRKILQLDKASGRLKRSANAMISGQGLYLVQTADQIVCVNLTDITTHSFERFGIVRPRALRVSENGRELLRGRVIGTDSSLLVPIDDGLVMIETQRLTDGGVTQSKRIDLGGSGILVALDGQILLAGENEISSYLSWDIAQRLLIQRIEEAGDIHAAVTMSELALRAGHDDEIIPAIDRAMGMLRAGGVGRDDEFDEVRSRLFSTMLEMVGLPGGLESVDDSYRVGAGVRTGLLERAGRIASTSGQLLEHQMTLGAWMTVLGETNDAVGVYHGILQDESLASGMWSGAGLAIRAEIEATHQLDLIVAKHGRGVCAIFDEFAAGDLEALGNDGDASAYEQLAKRYPWAPSTPGAWAIAAAQRDRFGDAPASVWAAKNGLESIERLGVHGVDSEDSLIDLLGSIYIGGLIGSQREDEAAREATRLADLYPSLALIVDGERIEPSELWAGLSLKLSGPVLGSRFVQTETPDLIAGSPVRSPMRSSFDSMVFFAPQLRQARLVRFVDGHPEVSWTRESPGIEPPVVVVENGFQTVLHWASVSGGGDKDVGLIEAVDTETGVTRWLIEDAGGVLVDGSMRVPDDIAEMDRQFTSPTEGAVPIDQILSSSDGSTMVIADRIGRAMGIDLISGQIMWNVDLPINRVYDMDLRGGVLGVVGMLHADPGKEGGVVVGRHTRVASIDVRTGQLIQLLDGQTATPRWIRVAGSGNLIVGTNLRVMSVSTRTGSLDWVLHTPELFRSNAGWIVDESLVVLDEFVNLWSIGLDDGKFPRTSLDSKGRIVERGWIEVREHGDDIVFAASGGVGVFDSRGRTAGIDSERTSRPFVGAGWGSDRVVMVKRAGGDDESKLEVPILLFDLESALLTDSMNLMLPSAIERQPIAVQVSNGVVVVGFGEVSVLVQTE